MRVSAKSAALAKSVQSILAEKRAVQAMEQGLIQTLNSVLGKIGYKAVPTGKAGRRTKRGRPPGKAARGTKPRRAAAKRGRPRSKRRGRPRKAK